MTCSAFTKEEIEAQIAALKLQLGEISTAISQTLVSQQYSLDTGQTRTSVMRAQLSQLQNTRKAILDEIAYWQGLLCESEGEAGGTGGSVTRIVPGW